NWFDASRREHMAVRERVGLFDQSCFAKFAMTGRDVMRLLNRVSCNHVDVPAGRIVYTQWLNEKGGIEADLTVFRWAETSSSSLLRRDLTAALGLPEQEAQSYVAQADAVAGATGVPDASVPSPSARCKDT